MFSNSLVHLEVEWERVGGVIPLWLLFLDLCLHSPGRGHYRNSLWKPRIGMLAKTNKHIKTQPGKKGEIFRNLLDPPDAKNLPEGFGSRQIHALISKSHWGIRIISLLCRLVIFYITGIIQEEHLKKRGKERDRERERSGWHGLWSIFSSPVTAIFSWKLAQDYSVTSS